MEHQLAMVRPDAAEQVRRIAGEIHTSHHQKKPSLFGL
jgi:hypothetical protein